MFCKFCGKEIDNEAVFCPECGRNLKLVKPSNEKKEVVSSKDDKNNRGFVLCAAASVLILIAGAFSAYTLDRKMNSPWVTSNTFNLDQYKVEKKNIGEAEPVFCYRIPDKQLRLLENARPLNIVCDKTLFTVSQGKYASESISEPVKNLMESNGYNVVFSMDTKGESYVIASMGNRALRFF